MKLSGQDGKSFELWIVDYQFHDDKTDEYDSNWLTVGIRLIGFEKEWITSDPSLLTWELKSLAHRLKDILTESTLEKEIDFMEPNLKFELVDKVGDAFKFRTFLTLESKPTWYTKDEIFSFDLVVDRKQLEHSVERIESQLIRFPGRAGVKLN